MSDFFVATITPAGVRDASLAIATARAGGIAILDREFCDDAERAERNLRDLISRAPQDAIVGLRLHVSQIESSKNLLARLRDRAHWVVLTGWEESSQLSALSSQGPVVLEIRDASDASLAAARKWKATAWIARGSECGGWIGPDAAFILAQKLLAVADVPVYVQGGIGPATAAGCRAAGAAGVVLDDQLWLMPESPLPSAWKKTLEDLDGQDALPIGDDDQRCRVLVRPDLRGSQSAHPKIGWSSPDEYAWPAGQAITFAAHLRDRYKTTGRLIAAIRDSSREHVAAAAKLQPLGPESPLAQSHGTRYPIVQGPMTRVSDSPSFAKAIADAGGLPLLALALMSGEQARTLINETRDAVGDRSWGVGILGFVPPDRRDEQLAALIDAHPPFALISGGRPDHAANLEQHGIATYLHVPVPKLLPLFLEQGTRRFVFEGRECGGHVGPLSSFVLWESMINVLLRDVPAAQAEQIHVLFAGGIHDARSAAIVSALAAPLAERGMKVGVLMGSAYLFTKEAVACGAIGEEFQQQALRCTQTVKLKTGPGHVVRCAPSPFIDHFESERRRMTKQGVAPDEINDTLARLALGRSRVASKGMLRDGDGLVKLDRTKQRREGMFMMGSVATMRDAVVTIEELHSDVSAGAREILRDLASEQRDGANVKPADVAVIGIGAILPGAPVPRAFWRNILEKTDSITEVPKHRFDMRLLYSPDTKEKDKSYSKWGGFIDELPFDPLRFGIPPNSMPVLSTTQLLTLEVARQALADAGYEDGGFDRENTAVILGAAANGDLEQGYIIRSMLPYIVDNPTPEMWQRLPEWSEESFAGVLANVTAGRIANRLDLGGSNYTIDAACASSLAAVDAAVHELRNGHANMVVAGGVDIEQHPHFFLGFSRTQAFSPRGKVQTFDRKADGIVISEGVVVMVLKRLADAERDGDRVYAVIKGVAGSSDGKALGMTAPRPIGQRRAVNRAYKSAGFSPSTIGMYEAHGTGTPVGDKAELETITSTLEASGAPAKSCAIGSVKTLIGHTKAAAGLCGLTKAILALHYKTLPPHFGVDDPLEPLARSESPVYLLREPRPWFANAGTPRRAGVSAFGFGGTNFHVALEEYRGNLKPQATGADEWPYELILLRGDENIEKLLAEGTQLRLSEIAASLGARGGATRAIVASSIDDLRKQLASTSSGGQAPSPVPQKIAFLFSGQGSQHLNMCRELAVYFPEVREALEKTNLTNLIYPPSAFNEEEERSQEHQLNKTDVAQPAIGAISIGLLKLAKRLGLNADMLAGHSFGELTALHAAGVYDEDTFLRLAETRGRLMAQAPDGAMAAVSAPPADIEKYLKDVVIANRNAPRQTVISGARDKVEAAVAKITAEGISARMLPVSGAFHSPLMAAAEKPLIDAIRACKLDSPRIPVYGNATAEPYDKNVRKQLESHLRSAVDFAGEIRAMTRDGANVFIELGPKSVLTGLVSQNVEGDHVAVSFGNGGLRGLLTAIATLINAGVAVDVNALFADRDIPAVDLEELAKKALPDPRAWWIDGGGVRRTRNDPRDVIGTLPRVDLETAQAAKSRPVAKPAARSDELLQGYVAYQETMRQFLATQENVMARFLGGEKVATPAIQVSATPPPAIEAPQPQPEPQVQTALLDFTQLVINLVSARTGYPADVLGLDQDIEAELGIDSIKRMEIADAVMKKLPPGSGPSRVDELLKLKTLKGWIDILQKTSTLAPQSGERVAEGRVRGEPAPRFIIKAYEEPAPLFSLTPLSGLFLITEDDFGIAPRVAESLRELGAEAIVINELPEDIEGQVQGIVHLAPLSHAKIETLEAWRNRARVEVKNLFHLVRAAASDLRYFALQGGAYTLTASNLGGAFGRNGKCGPGSPLSGGNSGLLRTMANEIEGVHAKAVDFDDVSDVAAIASRIVNELLAGDADFEIGYVDDARSVFRAEAAKVEATSKPIVNAGDVVLITGGARGITAEIARELAQPGVRIVLAGRSPEPPAESGETLSLDADALRRLIFDRARAAGEKITPVAAEEQVKTILQRREIRDNLAAFRKQGAEVEYRAIDVRNEHELGALIDDLYKRHGRIDAVVHGAGIIEDKLLVDKDPASFDRVFDTKADSAFILSKQLRGASLKWMVLFSSVAGRIGNRGQIDYAAANEVVNRLAWSMSIAWPSARVVAVNWGPWSGAGMASPGVIRQLEERGIHAIEPPAGRRFFLDELASSAHDAEVIAGDGTWNPDRDSLLDELFAALTRGDRP